MTPLRVLLIEDVEDDAALVMLELERAGYALVSRRVDSASGLQAALAEQSWDVIISDYSLPRLDAPTALAQVKATGLDLPFIVVSGTIGDDLAVAMMKAGAHDYLAKGQLGRLVPALERELRESAMRRERIGTEAALRQSEASFRNLIEQMPDIVIVHREGSVVYANPAAVTQLGYASAADLIGMHYTGIVHPDDVPIAGPRIAAVAHGHTAPLRELRWLRRDRSNVTLQVIGQGVIFDGHLAGVVVARDVSEQKKVEAQLLVSDRLASVGTLAAGVAHEINNPLAAVIANLDYALGELRAPTPANDLEDSLREAREAAEHVRQIVRDLKLFSRSDDQERRGPIDVRRVLESSLRMAWNEIRHRARLSTEYGDAPEVIANEARLGQVFLNLVINAAQAIPEGRAERNEIRVVTRHVRDRVEIEVRDTGPGMPPDVLAKLFTPFFTTKPVGVGTGLGLSICHRIVSSLGGEITVESKVGVGSSFRVSLPVVSPEPAEPAVKAPTPARGTPTVARRGRVMLIDDEPMVARAVRRVLGNEHEVTALVSARDALAKVLGGERFDVVLCDLMMPDMTGMELHAELVRHAPQQAERMIFLTGGAFTPAARTFLDDTPNARVEKPFDVKFLLNLVNERVQEAATEDAALPPAPEK